MVSFLCLGDSFEDPNFAGNAPPTYADGIVITKGYTRLNNLAGSTYRSAILGTCMGTYPDALPQLSALTAFLKRVVPFAPNVLVIKENVNDYYGACQNPFITIDCVRQNYNAFWYTFGLAGLAPTQTIVLGLPYLTGQGYNPPFGCATHADARLLMDNVCRAELYRAIGSFGNGPLGSPIWLGLDGMTSAMIGTDGTHPTGPYTAANTGQQFIYNTVLPFCP